MNQDAIALSKRFQFSLENPETAVATDAALLARFVDAQDHEAFSQLLERHGPVVWGVCRRQLVHLTDAEDVFQATFLVLFQQAGRIRQQTSLASWLHGVAWRIARKLKRTTMRRNQRERTLAQTEARLDEPGWDGTVNVVLESELARLPEEYREPLLLCYLQGQTQARAAQTLGWPIGTVAGRLSRAKELLKSRLVRRGVTPAALASLGIEQAWASVPAGLLEKTLNTIQTGGAASVALLAKAGVVNMWMSKWLILGAVGTCLTVGIGVGYSAWRGMTQQEEPPVKESNSAISTPQNKQDEHPDYQAIQGRWRCERRHEVTDTLHAVEDLTFRGRKYAKTTYTVEKNGMIGERWAETEPLEFVLDPSQKPKHMELQAVDVNTTDFSREGIGGGPGAQKVDGYTERSLCTYELQGDTLTIKYGGIVPLLRNTQGKVIADRNSPQARFPTEGKETAKMVYRRMSQEKNTTSTNPATTVGNESTERGRLLQERVKVSETIYKLRLEAYRAGREYITVILDTVRDRLEAKLALADHLKSDTRPALQEALDDAKWIEGAANAKHKAGSANLLELTTAQFARLGYELRLLK